jgi:hypothetical protein
MEIFIIVLASHSSNGNFDCKCRIQAESDEPLKLSKQKPPLPCISEYTEQFVACTE